MLCCLTWKIFIDVPENTLKMNYVQTKHYYIFATSQDVIFKIILNFISTAVRTSGMVKAKTSSGGREKQKGEEMNSIPLRIC